MTTFLGDSMATGLQRFMMLQLQGGQSAMIAPVAVGATRLGGLTPTLPGLSLEEASYMLQGLYGANISQLRRGTPGINDALVKGRIRYIRDDPQELWEPIKTIWIMGGGDCEDLSAAVAAELTLKGVLARPVIYRVNPRLAHAVVEILDPRLQRRLRVGMKYFGHPVIKVTPEGYAIIDPSRTGGMGR